MHRLRWIVQAWSLNYQRACPNTSYLSVSSLRRQSRRQSDCSCILFRVCCTVSRKSLALTMLAKASKLAFINLCREPSPAEAAWRRSHLSKRRRPRTPVRRFTSWSSNLSDWGGVSCKPSSAICFSLFSHPIFRYWVRKSQKSISLGSTFAFDDLYPTGG